MHVHTWWPSKIIVQECNLWIENNMKLWCTTEHGVKVEMWHRQKVNGLQVFLSGSGGTGKSHVLQLIQWDMCYILTHTINPSDD